MNLYAISVCFVLLSWAYIYLFPGTHMRHFLRHLYMEEGLLGFLKFYLF